jgi:hypothetical protein
MRPGLTLHIAPVKLVQPLKRDGATLFSSEGLGDFLPRIALLALCADEINVWLKPAAIGSPAAASIFGFRFHRWKFNPANGISVNEQGARLFWATGELRQVMLKGVEMICWMPLNPSTPFRAFQRLF